MRLRHLAPIQLAIFLVALAACGVSGENTSPSTSAGWPLTIGTDHSQYAVSDVINVTVTNHQSAAAYALDTRSSCSILTLQVLVNGNWQDSSSAPCAIKRVALPVKVNAGATYTATIRAGLTDKSTASFPAGTYRFVLVFYATPDDRAGGTTTYSAQFTITGASNGSGSGAPSSAAPGGLPRP